MRWPAGPEAVRELSAAMNAVLAMVELPVSFADQFAGEVLDWLNRVDEAEEILAELTDSLARCTRCGRALRHPHYIAERAYGRVCAGKVRA